MSDRQKLMSDIKKEISEMKEPIKLAEQLLNLINEMSGSEKRELKSRFIVILTHLLKWDYQPKARCKSWILTAIEQSDQLSDLLEESPSLISTVNAVGFKDDCYQKALSRACVETGITRNNFPQTIPKTYNFLDIAIMRDHPIFKEVS